MGPEQLRTPGPPRYATRGISVRRYRRKNEEKGETSSLRLLMTDSRLNAAERGLQHSFMKSRLFNGLLMLSAVTAAYWPIRALPSQHRLPKAIVPLQIRMVELPSVQPPLRLVGAWDLEVDDGRFGGVSALAIDRGRFLAVTDRGAAVRFDFPTTAKPLAELVDLRAGPGSFGKKWTRDAESLAPDQRGRGWWVGYEQNHSLWLYSADFDRALATVDLKLENWRNNRGAEGLLTENDDLLVTAENGRDAVRVATESIERFALNAGADVAEAARAPDGSSWLLLRWKGLSGIEQTIAPLFRTKGGYRVGPGWPVPKGMFDNFEGMAIEPRPDGSWRFWLISDDGHRIMARTLMVALDYWPAGHSKGPATSAGPSKKPLAERP